MKPFLRKSTISGIIFSLIFLCLIPVAVIKAPVKKDLILTCYNSTPPVIDGHIGTTEWAPALTYNITLYNLDNQADTIIIVVKTLYTEENNLIFAVTVPDTDKGEGDDQLAIVLKTNTAEPLVRIYDEGWGYGKEQDIKYIYAHNNDSIDGVTKDVAGLIWEDDVSVSGTEDSVGKVHPKINYDEYELEFPLDSGDTPGKDPALALNDDIEIFFYYKDDNAVAMIIYSQIRQADSDFDYNALRIGCTATTPVQIFPIIVGIISMTFASILYSKKKKK